VGLFSRIWRVIKGWLLIGVEKAEDPEVILTEAKEAMDRELAKAKEAAVTAIGQRNLLRGMLADQEKRVRELDAQARTALKAGNEDLARQVLVEKSNIQKTVENLNVQLAQAEQAATSVKESIRALEEQVRQRAAERLALIAGWKQAQIQESLNKALSGVSLDSHVQAFEKASEKVKDLQAKADARVEVASGDLNSKLAQLRNTMSAQQAEDELQALKSEMGLLPPAQETEQTTEEQKVRNIEV
jgi:phage shock protein A